MVTFAVGFQLYERTQSALALGLTGLAEGARSGRPPKLPPVVKKK